MRIGSSILALTLAALAAACGSGGSKAAAPTAAGSHTATMPAVSPTAAASPAVVAAGTRTPTPTGTPVPSATPPPPARPTAPPPPTAPASPTPVAAPRPATLTLVAHGLQFSETSLRAAAGAPLTIVLDNQDAGIQHDIVVYTPGGTVAASSAVTTGPSSASLTFTPQRGVYPFKCSVHPQQMNGVLTVE